MFDLTPLTVLMRWVHLASMAVLVGGALIARLVLARSARAMPPEARDAAESAAAVACRPVAIGAILGLVVSGVYQFYSSSGHSTRHNVIFGLKMLLALHVFSAAILIVQPRNQRRARQIAGLAISGLLVVLLSALLRQFY